MRVCISSVRARHYIRVVTMQFGLLFAFFLVSSLLQHSTSGESRCAVPTLKNGRAKLRNGGATVVFRCFKGKQFVQVVDSGPNIAICHRGR
jgi:hypothetical protein